MPKFMSAFFKRNPNNKLQITNKYICDFVLIVMCLYCITVKKLGIKNIIINYYY